MVPLSSDNVSRASPYLIRSFLISCTGLSPCIVRLSRLFHYRKRLGYSLPPPFTKFKMNAQQAPQCKQRSDSPSNPHHVRNPAWTETTVWLFPLHTCHTVTHRKLQNAAHMTESMLQWGNILKTKKRKKREQRRVLSTSTCGMNGFLNEMCKWCKILLLTFKRSMTRFL